MDDVRLRAMFATIDAVDWDALPQFFHAEIVYERPGFPPLCGLDRVLRFYHNERKIVRSTHHVEGTVVQDDLGAVWGRVGCVLTNGTETELGFADIYHFDRNLVRLRRTHFFVPGV
ncbi:MAG: nuclear transport factor 2 family protein [Actinomycetota bacterium]|nr:nuclear transport factor 2 family protein [Actinomycetota bacterium]